jgi:hypothetical protein
MGAAALQIFYRFAGITFTRAAARSRACRDACQRDVRALQCSLLCKRRNGVPPMISDDGRSMPRRNGGAGLGAHLRGRMAVFTLRGIPAHISDDGA